MNLLKNKMGMRVLTLALCAALSGSVLAVKAESVAGETVVQEAVQDENMSESREIAHPAQEAEEPDGRTETGEATEESTAQPTDEPTAEPSNEPTTEPTDEPTAEPMEQPTIKPTEQPTTEPTAQPTTEPTAEPSAEPTTEPTQQPTTEPTAEPMPEGAYKITVVSPAKWQKDKATAKINIVDVNGTGWANIRIVVATENGWQTVVDGDDQSAGYAVELRENATIHVSITDRAGNVQAKSEAISCFDSTPPTVKAGVSGEVICIEATDSTSGVAAVYVNGHKLKYSGTTLDANIRAYADGRQQIAIYAVDLAGNVSQKVYVKNPFYGRDDSGSSGNDSRPSATKKPSSGGAKTTPKPTATPMPMDVPQATMQPQTTAAPDIDALYALLAQLAGGTGTSEPTEGKPFSMGGNMKTVDLLYSKATNKQFITVQTRKGETYYLVIDYDKPLDKDGEQYETYFLNLVDDRDLFGVVSKDEQPTPEPTATPTPKPTAEPKPEAERTTDSTAMMALVLLVVLIAGGAAAFVVLRKKRDAQPRYNTELDDDDDEEEIGEDNEEE